MNDLSAKLTEPRIIFCVTMMKKRAMDNLFGNVLSYDPRLLDSSLSGEALVLRERHEDLFSFFTKTGRMLSIAHGKHGRAPDRIIVDRFPLASLVLDHDGWSFQKGTLYYHRQKVLVLASKSAAGNCAGITPVVDFPGHLRSHLSRFSRQTSDDVRQRGEQLAEALKQPLTEAVEGPLLRLLGFGGGQIPLGDAVLKGFLLTGNAFLFGRRIRVDWLQRLKVEVRRFLQRTTPFSSAQLQFALEGRVSELEDRFFSAMAKDLESLGETVCHEIHASPLYPGTAFLFGVQTALDMVRLDTNLGEAFPRNRLRQRRLLSSLT
jgi:hypothetical protein